MKLTEINIDNFLGIESFHTQLTENTCIVCGPNASGKSSVQNAIRMILTGEPSRVHLKKNYGELVRDGEAAQGVISLTTNTVTETAVIKRSGRCDGLPNPDNVAYALRAVLEMGLFASLDQKERRAFMFGLFDVSMSFDEIKAMLLEKNFREADIDELKPLLKSGFPAACTEAKERTSQARGVWKSITGETYGPEKAEGWQMALPEELDGNRYAVVKEQIEIGQQTVRDCQAKLDANDANIKSSQQYKISLRELEETASQLEAAEAIISNINSDYQAVTQELAALEKELSECKCEDKFDPLPCPECGAALELQLAPELEHSILIPYNPPEGDPEPAAELEPLVNEYRKSIAEMDKTIAKADKQKRKAVEAQATLKTLDEFNAAFLSEREIADLNSQSSNATIELGKLEYEQQRMDEIQGKLTGVEEKNKKAATAHEEVKVWKALSEILSPNGLPAELVSAAINPFNQQLENNAHDSRWGLVKVTQDMDITYNNRLYHLLSESEKWRVDAMLSATIGFISGYNFLMLDRVDILSLPERNNMLNWCDILSAEENAQVLLFATLKAKPELEGMQSLWLEDGLIAENKL